MMTSSPTHRDSHSTPEAPRLPGEPAGKNIAPTAAAESRCLRHHRVGSPSPVAIVYPYRFFAAAGGLLSYGVDVARSVPARPTTSIAFFGARNRETFRYRRRPNTSW